MKVLLDMLEAEHKSMTVAFRVSDSDCIRYFASFLFLPYLVYVHRIARLMIHRYVLDRLGELLLLIENILKKHGFNSSKHSSPFAQKCSVLCMIILHSCLPFENTPISTLRILAYSFCTGH
ncbi:hypothetical protein I3843_01G298800 [Carya illinoinensis]|uniref:Uncharacterized protein n=1 Tax=Carya illinoinensis TaxID=32201 RepID=A0A922G6C5_CARIL|nr:hypothetical protein I3842_01G309600 [Carya illinoinensis]KAG7999243.1 hypothetical protein I3843_01G298800 [Carya illinoinensis]